MQLGRSMQDLGLIYHVSGTQSFQNRPLFFRFGAPILQRTADPSSAEVRTRVPGPLPTSPQPSAEPPPNPHESPGGARGALTNPYPPISPPEDPERLPSEPPTPMGVAHAPSNAAELARGKEQVLSEGLATVKMDVAELSMSYV